MKTKLFILLAAFCCSVTAMAQDDIDDERKSIYDDGFVEVDGIWYRHNMYDEDVDHYYASVIGPEEMDPDEYYDAFAATIYYEGDVVIPASIRVNGADIPVEGISYRAFCDRPGGSGGPAEMPLANGPRRMPAPGPAFPVTSVTLPNSLRWISDMAFEGCSTLKSISFGNGLESIGWRAFFDCSGLTSISIPASVTEISSEAFFGCNGLTSISVASGNTKYDSRNNCNAIIEKSSKKLMAGCVNTVIPEDVVTINNGAFYDCDGLTSITIPNSVESINSDAFHSCDGLISIIIPNSVKSIGNSAFAGCSQLVSVIIGSKVSSYGYYSPFDYCNKLREVTALNPTPVAISSRVFPDRVKQTLYVAKGSKDAYKAADVWKEFKTIAEVGTSPEVVKGDMNGDGVLTIIDALIIIEMILSNQ